MTSKGLILTTISSAVLALAIAGCGSQSAMPGGTSTQVPVSTQHVRGAVNLGGFLAVSSCQTCSTYQSAPGAEYMYRGLLTHPRRTITTGISAPWVGLVFNSTGDLFVANCTTCLTGQAGVNNVVEIKPGQNRPAVTITNGIKYPFDLVVDSSNTIYASNLGCYSPSCTGTVVEYPQGYTSGAPSASINVKYPLGMAIDSNQNLYVANCAICSTGVAGSDQILVYAHGTTTPSSIITTGVNEPVALAVDSNNNLYVADCMNCGLGAAVYDSGTDSITEYAPNGSLIKTITFSGVDVPFSLAVDPSGNLFVANFAVNSVTKYPANATIASQTITQGISGPGSITESLKNMLYVSNSGNNTVTGYAATYSGGTPNKTISVMYPSSIAAQK